MNSISFHDSLLSSVVASAERVDLVFDLVPDIDNAPSRAMISIESPSSLRVDSAECLSISYLAGKATVLQLDIIGGVTVRILLSSFCYKTREMIDSIIDISGRAVRTHSL